MENYVFLIIGLILFCGLMAYSFINLDRDSSAFVCLIVALIVIMFYLSGYLNSKKDTAIKCLKDNNPYKMEIRYELKDSVYVPKDTIYVLKD